MAKVYGITPIELRDGVKGEEFETFFHQQFGPRGKRLGWTYHVLKADRGKRAGKYAVICELPNIESRDRYVTMEGITNEELQLLGDDFRALEAKLMSLVADWPFTDYVELGK